MRDIQWFKDRVGKTIFRDYNGCDCKACKHIMKEGLIVADDYHAEYLEMMQGNCDSGDLNYRDNKYCNCDFVMIFRNQKDDKAYCSQCKLEVIE